MNLTKKLFSTLCLGAALCAPPAAAQCEPGIVSTVNARSSTFKAALSSDGDYLFVVGLDPAGEALMVCDLANPAQPVIVKRYTTVGPYGYWPGNNTGLPDGSLQGVQDLAVVGNSLYLAGPIGGVVLVDVTDPLNATFSFPSMGYSVISVAVDVDGDRLYHGLGIADISTPSSPSALSPTWGGFRDVVGAGNHAYAVGPTGAYSVGLTSYDVSDPTQPVALNTQNYPNTAGNYGLSSLANRIEAYGNAVYVANASATYLYDVTDPANPVRQTLELPSAVSIEIVDDVLYIGDIGSGVRWYDLSDPLAPSLIDDVLFPQPNGAPDARGLAIGGEYIYAVGPGWITTIAHCISSDTPPVASAGANFSVDEGQVGVTLDGSGSSDPDGDALAYAWNQVAGTTVALYGASTAQPAFDAPLVALGGETLTFELAVSANGVTVTDQVNVTVVNVNHPPVADAGDDQSVAEGSLVTLGPDPASGSFDVDNDTFTYAWTQVSGAPVVLSSASAAQPTFTAPMVASGATETLVFSLTVDDGFPADVPAPGYTMADSTDSVTVTVTNVNNPPVALAGADQTANENTLVALSGGGSDPDGDALSYSWAQVGGLAVVLTGELTATPSFTAPFVNPGGGTLAFELTVDDGYGGSATDTVLVHVQNANDPPLVSAAAPTVGTLWPPRHDLVLVGITGVSDPDDNATIVITGVTQDEPTNGTGDGDTAIDAVVNPDGTVYLRAERAGNGDGRVYHVHFIAYDLEGSAAGVVTVGVPHKKKSTAGDGGELYDSTL